MKLEFYFSKSAKSYTFIATDNKGEIESLQLESEDQAATAKHFIDEAVDVDFAEWEIAVDDYDDTSAIIAEFTTYDETTNEVEDYSKAVFRFDDKYTAGEVGEFTEKVLDMQAADETANALATNKKENQ